MNDKEYECCFFCENPLSEKDIIIDWSFDYNKKCHKTFDKCIDDIWNAAMVKNSSIFDETKFRLHDVKFSFKNSSNLHEFPAMKILLGLTSYKEFIGTNISEYANNLAEDGIKDFNDSQAYMSDPLGVGALLETSDKCIIFIKRSSLCAELPEKFDRPGGHPEPKRILNGERATSASIRNISSEAVVKEIFSSVIDEICSEVNIPVGSLNSPKLLGFVKNNLSGRRPSAEFYVRTSLTSTAAIEHYYKGTQSEAEESTEILSISKTNLAQLSSDSNSSFYNQLTPAAKGAIMLFTKFELMEEFI